MTFAPGYVPADELAGLLAEHDVLALTYRTATASQNALLAHKHGLAVLATSVGSFPQDVRDEVDGLLVPARDQEALVAVLHRLADPDELVAAIARRRPGTRSDRPVGQLSRRARNPDRPRPARARTRPP